MNNEIRKFINEVKEFEKLNLNDKVLQGIFIGNNIISESGYSSVMKAFRGLRPSIKTLAILTGENPGSEEHSKEFNKLANSKLKEFFAQGHFGYVPVKGSYGNIENSFIVYNISQTTAFQIGEKFGQDSIIFAETERNENQTEDEIIPMTFKLIGTNKSNPHEFKKIIGERSVVIDRNNAEDFYSDIKGRKFVIPFYDVIDRLIDKEGKSYDLIRTYEKSKWEGGKIDPTTTKIDYDINEQIKDNNSIYNKVEEYLNQLQESAIKTIGSSSYHARCRIDDIIKK